MAKSIEKITFEEWSDQLETHPDLAISKIYELYNQKEDDWCDNALVRSLAGGPHEGITWPIYNAVGDVYPKLTRDQKDAALHAILSVLDGINYSIVNGARGVGHTTGIREPLLLADIGTVRAIYWPGLDEGKYLMSQHESFESLKAEIIEDNGLFNPKKVKSDFAVAYSLLRSDFCDYGVQYAGIANPGFLERTLQGIVGLRFGFENADIVKGTKRLQELLPEPLHARIDELREKGGWADYNKFK